MIDMESIISRDLRKSKLSKALRQQKSNAPVASITQDTPQSQAASSMSSLTISPGLNADTSDTNLSSFTWSTLEVNDGKHIENEKPGRDVNSGNRISQPTKNDIIVLKIFSPIMALLPRPDASVYTDFSHKLMELDLVWKPPIAGENGIG